MTARAVALDNLRALSADELAAHLREQRGQLFQVRLQQTIGQVEDHRQIRAIRKEIARTMTVQVEYRLAAERGEQPVAPATPAHTSRRARDAEAAAAAPPQSRRRTRKTAAADSAAALDASEETSTTAAAGDAAEVDDPIDAVSDIDVELVEPGADSAEGDAAITGADPSDEASAEEQVSDEPTSSTASSTDTAGSATAGKDQE